MFNRDSKVINSIRFPLACMVVILHSYVAVQGFHISQLEWINLTGVETYSLVGITFSLVLTQVAVPLFFFISGYLFYRGLTNWSWEIYFDKLKRRIRTLIIPYFVWNTIQAIIIIGILFFAYILFNKPVGRISDWFQNVGGFWGIYWANDATATIKENIFGWISYKTYPLLVPMWFIRDLMLVVVLSPILWYFLKKTLSLFLVLTAFFWIIGTGTNIPGLSFNSILFFSMGGAFFCKVYKFYWDV